MTVGHAQGFINEVVSPNAELLVTDAHPAYRALHGYPQHKVVNHHLGEYKRGDAHTNSIKSVWALLKRQIVGTHHWVSPKHLQQYVSEMAWRLNRRTMTAEERVNALLRSIAPMTGVLPTAPGPVPDRRPCLFAALPPT